MDLSAVQAEATRLSPLMHLATVYPDGTPHVAPVHPAWLDGTVWISSFVNSVKVRNIGTNPVVAAHWQVDESGDGVALWGTASVHGDIDTKRRLWEGVFDYDLDAFFPKGPDSADATFIAIEPSRALVLKQYGLAGRDTWQR
jgi:general stress protein 26